MYEKLQTLEGILSLLNLVCLGLLIGKLHRTGLKTSYPSLFRFLAAQALTSAALMVAPWRSNVYAAMYFAREAIVLLLAVMVVHEVYRVALAPLPAISAASRRAIFVLLPCSAAIGLLSATIDTEVLPRQSRIVHRFFTVERILDLNILFFLLAITAVMLWFPLRMRRNLVLYIVGFVVHFLALSCGLLLANVLSQQYLRVVSNTLMMFSLACFLFWFLLFRVENEERTAVTGHRWNPAAMEELSAQLTHINSALSRLVR